MSEALTVNDTGIPGDPDRSTRGSTILILGGGQMQIPAIVHAKRMGLTVIVADADPTVPGAGMADHFEQVDLKDREAMLETARRYRERGALDGVFTAGTDFSSTVAYVAERLGLPGIPFETALDATDKGRMRAVLARAGVPCPEFIVLTNVEEVMQVRQRLPFPLVVKPVDNMGSRGVRRVDTDRELDAAVRSALPLSRSSRVIVERYIEGPEFSVDALVYRGEITICGLADRHIAFAPYFVELGHTMPSDAPAGVRAQVLDAFRQAVRALGITDGAAKGDIKYSPSGPVVGEIAARLSGGYMSGWTFPYSSGVHVTAGAVRIALGLHPGDLAPVKRHVSAERAFISIPGVVSAIEGLDRAGKDERVRDIFLRIRKGSRVVFPTNNVEKCGNVITEADTRELAVDAAECACRSLLVRLEPRDEDTFRYLFSAPCRFPPNAFTLRRTENIGTFEAMPVFMFPADAPDPGSSNHGPSGGEVTDSQAIGILPLPAVSLEPDRDWHGLSFAEALEFVFRTGGAAFVGTGNGTVSSARSDNLHDRPGSGAPVLGRLFWSAFLRGGVQGGVWILDTARALMRDGAGVVRTELERFERFFHDAGEPGSDRR